MGDHTRFGWLQRAAVILSVLLAFLCMQFFGTFSTLVLCGLGGLTYCSVRFVCFASEAWKWRTKLDRCYKVLFSSKQGCANWKSQSGPNQANGVPKSSNRVLVSKPSHKEAQKLIELIMQEFVLGWYDDITNDTEFPEDIEKVLEHVFLEVNVRLQKIDLEDTVCELLALVLTYLEALNEIGMVEYNGVSVFDVSNEKCLRAFESNPKLVHRALRSPDSELRYYRRAIDAVVQCAVPPEYRNCDIVCTFVRELLLKNIVVPLIDLLCDPDFLHMSIPIILSKASPEKIQRELKNIERENEELHQRKLARGPGSQRRRFMSASQFAQHVQYGLPIGSSPHSTPLGDFADQATSGTTTSSHSNQPQQPQADTATALGTRPSPSSPIPCPKHSPTHVSLPPTQAHSGAPDSPQQYEFTPPHDVTDDLLYIDLAPIYVTRHVRVDGGGPGNSYIGYIFKFPKHMLQESDLKDLDVHESDTHLEAMKRFSDFTKFHSSVLHSPLSIYIRDLELPNKRGFEKFVSKLPFTAKDPDPTIILERKQGLERYLQTISSVKEIARSELFRKFLRSGACVLKDANVVKPHKHKLPRRRTLLQIMKVHSSSADSAEAMPLPKRPMEVVLSSYLSAHLPLPCQTLHSSVDSIPSSAGTTKDQPNSEPQSNKTAHHPAMHSSKVSTTSVASDNKDDDVSEREPSLSYIVTPAGQSRYDTQSEKSIAETVTGANEQHSQLSSTVVSEESQTISSESSASLINPPIRISGSKMKQGFISSPCDQHSKSGSSQYAASTGVPGSKKISSYASLYLHCRSLFSKLLTTSLGIFFFIVQMVRQSLNPLSPETSLKLAKEQKQRTPLSNVLLSLASEASKKHCPHLWACSGSSQIAILSLAGGGMERFLWKELHSVIYNEENWARALYHLRHTLWPEGKLMTSIGRKPKGKEMKRKAAEAFREFLPNFFPHIVGSSAYDRAVHHCIDCIQNPRMNRHFLLQVIDVLLPKIVPEMQDIDFHRRIVTMRTASRKT